MVNYIILAGGYATFIVSYLFNPEACSLTVLKYSQTGTNPSWIASHLTDRSILYAVNENANGTLQSFNVLPDGALSDAIDTVSTGGDGPAFATPLSTGQVMALNYGSGNGQAFPTTLDPEHFDTSTSSIFTFPTFPPPSEGVSHPHMALEHCSEVFVPDLGGDKIWRLVEDGSPGKWKIQGQIDQPGGSGPRHIAIQDNFLYVIHERSSTLTVQEIPPAPNGTSPLLANVSIIPPDPPAGAAFAAGELLLPPPSTKFPIQYIYASNRNTGVQDPRGDAIAIYRHDRYGGTHALTRVAEVYTGLDQVRGMAIGGAGDGGEEFLVASGNAGAGGVVVFRRVGGGAGMEVVARNLDVPTRSTFVWL